MDRCSGWDFCRGSDAVFQDLPPAALPISSVSCTTGHFACLFRAGTLLVVFDAVPNTDSFKLGDDQVDELRRFIVGGDEPTRLPRGMRK
jgi:hypothetical protein